MLKVINLNKTYRNKGKLYDIIKNLSLIINKGEFVSIMGPSGSGKTTLLNCISGFIKYDSGSIYLNELNISNLNEKDLSNLRQKEFGFVFQDFMLVEGLTVIENIYLPQIIANKNINDMKIKTNEILKFLNIYDIRNKYQNEISGGQKQRVAIARALSNNPPIILADEPTGNLDSKSSLTVIKSFIAAKKKTNSAILMVTHDALAASYSDRVIILKDGQVVKQLINTKGQKEFFNDILNFMKESNYES